MAETMEGVGPRPVLIAVDFSRDSDAAVQWGLEYATQRGAPAILFHAIHDTAEAPGFYTRDGQSALTDIGKAARQMMDAQEQTARAILQERGSAIELSTELVEGLPSGRITEMAEVHDCDLIVIGTRGRSKMASLLMGSVAENVVHKARCPVVVVKASRAPAEPAADASDD